eukprot:5998551-Amphidinium_carterae.1
MLRMQAQTETAVAATIVHSQYIVQIAKLLSHPANFVHLSVLGCQALEEREEAIGDTVVVGPPPLSVETTHSDVQTVLQPSAQDVIAQPGSLHLSVLIHQKTRGVNSGQSMPSHTGQSMPSHTDGGWLQLEGRSFAPVLQGHLDGSNKGGNTPLPTGHESTPRKLAKRTTMRYMASGNCCTTDET